MPAMQSQKSWLRRLGDFFLAAAGLFCLLILVLISPRLRRSLEGGVNPNE